MQNAPVRIRGRRRFIHAAALAAGTLAVAALALGGADAAAADEEPTVTWSVSPADAAGPDGRAWVELEIDPGEGATEHQAVRQVSAEEIT